MPKYTICKKFDCYWVSTGVYEVKTGLDIVLLRKYCVLRRSIRVCVLSTLAIEVETLPGIVRNASHVYILGFFVVAAEVGQGV